MLRQLCLFLEVVVEFQLLSNKTQVPYLTPDLLFLFVLLEVSSFVSEGRVVDQFRDTLLFLFQLQHHHYLE